MNSMAFVLSVALLTGCASAAVSGYGAGDRSLPAQSADRNIVARVEQALAEDPIVRAIDLQVTAENGIVILRGQVPDSAASQRAEQVTRGIEGVRAVRNQLTVR